jgi:hypothetical protein
MIDKKMVIKLFNTSDSQALDYIKVKTNNHKINNVLLKLYDINFDIVNYEMGITKEKDIKKIYGFGFGELYDKYIKLKFKLFKMLKIKKEGL